MSVTDQKKVLFFLISKKIGRKGVKVAWLRQRRDFTCEKSGIDKAYKAHLRLNLWKLLINVKGASMGSWKKQIAKLMSFSHIAVQRQDGKSKGFAFVTFDTKEQL